MYLVRTEFAVVAGSAGEFEQLAFKVAQVRKGQAGYSGQTLLHSYGAPHKYVITSRWQNVESVWASYASDEFAHFVKETPHGIYTITRNDGYEGVLDVNVDPMPAKLDCEVLVDWTLNAGGAAAAAFEQSRKELFEIRTRSTKGFASGRLRRSGGTPNRYLIINIFDSVESSRANPGDEMQAFIDAHPASQYSSTPQQVEAYYVVQRW